ncbi:hypothetical protein PMIN06_010717 [Paraphaeosphaeria minitans]
MAHSAPHYYFIILLLSRLFPSQFQIKLPAFYIQRILPMGTFAALFALAATNFTVMARPGPWHFTADLEISLSQQCRQGSWLSHRLSAKSAPGAVNTDSTTPVSMHLWHIT